MLFPNYTLTDQFLNMLTCLGPNIIREGPGLETVQSRMPSLFKLLNKYMHKLADDIVY